MRVMTTLLASVAVASVLLLTGSADGSEYYYNGRPYGEGYRNSDGYVFQGGYWNWHGDAYTRALRQRAGYYNCGYYYPGAYYYHYVFHHGAAVPTYSSGSNYLSGNWRDRLLQIASERDRVEGEIRKAAFEQAYFTDSVKALGFEGNFHIQNYGYSPFGYGPGKAANYGGGNLQMSTAGAQGNTVYGYSYNTLANVYGDTNPAALYQQAYRLAESAQKYGDKATGGFQDIVAQDNDGRQKVAEILAKGQAVQEFLSRLDGNSAKVETKTFSFKVGPGQDGKVQIQRVEQPPQAQPPSTPPPREPPKEPSRDDSGYNSGKPGQTKKSKVLFEAWQASAKAKCAACHSGEKAKGGFDVAMYPGLDDDHKAVVIARLTTLDENRQMPRMPDGKAGVRLSAAEIQLWLAN